MSPFSAASQMEYVAVKLHKFTLQAQDFGISVTTITLDINNIRYK